MSSYIGITEAQSNPFAPLTSELVKQLRDNPLAIAQGAAGAPKVVSEGLDMFTGQGGTVTYIDLDRVDKVLIIFNQSTGRSYNLSTDNGATFGGSISAFGDVIVSLGSTNNAIRVNASHVIIGVSGVKP